MQNEDVFKNILVPVDGSFPSMISQELAVFVAKKFGSKVTVIHIAAQDSFIPLIENPQGTEEVDAINTAIGQFPRAVEIPKPKENPLPNEIISEIEGWYVQKGTQILQEAVARFKEEGIPVEEKLIAKGISADVIADEAKNGKYDLVIMGNAGEEERDQHLGSVAKKVAAVVEIPVLISREKILVSKILVPVDGSAKSEKALSYANLLAQKTGGKLTLMYVQESPLLHLKPEISSEVGKRILDHAASKIIGVQAEQKLESGDPAKKIIEFARKDNFDLIVMSSKGHGTMMRFLMGSVADHVIHYADRSVLLIK
jgi:nucleotide-binding universal stress UspA family protein